MKMLLAAAAGLFAASDPSAPPLQPSGPWVVEGQENLCMLTRTYGTEPARVVIGWQPLFMQSRMEMYVIANTAASAPRRGDASITFAPGGTVMHGSYVSVPMADGRRLSRINVPSDLVAVAGAATSMSIEGVGPPISVRLVRASAGTTALDACQHRLLRSWHVDEAALIAGRAPVALGTNISFDPGFYPAEAMRLGMQGRVVAIVNVGANGRATGCHVVVAVGDALDRATCDRGSKLRFRPGTDANGRPAESIYILPVRWVLPSG